VGRPKIAANGKGLAKNWNLNSVSAKPKLNLYSKVDASFTG